MDTWQEAATLVARWPRTLILTHDRPDGDALGASIAMKQVISLQGRTAEALLYDQVPARYCFLDSVCRFGRRDLTSLAGAESEFDGILIVDTCSWSQLEPVAPFLRSTRLPRVVVDHHATRDDIKGASGTAVYLVDATSASACGVIFEWCQRRMALDQTAREALFSGIATDTGWFRFSNTDPRTLRAAASLVEGGVRPDLMHARLIQSYTAARLRLMALVLGTLELHAENRVAMMNVSGKMFEQTGATAADTEDIVNEPMGVGSVAVSILLADMNDGRIRVNLRSKSPEVVPRTLDVAAIAKTFGGGGHHRAAGARVAGALPEVRERVLAAVLAALD